VNLEVQCLLDHHDRVPHVHVHVLVHGRGHGDHDYELHLSNSLFDTERWTVQVEDSSDCCYSCHYFKFDSVLFIL
jgi:hypothetical protein